MYSVPQSSLSNMFYVHPPLLQTMEIHETIAECMIFANHWVARRIAEAFPNAALVSVVYCLLA